MNVEKEDSEKPIDDRKAPKDEPSKDSMPPRLPPIIIKGSALCVYSKISIGDERRSGNESRPERQFTKDKLRFRRAQIIEQPPGERQTVYNYLSSEKLTLRLWVTNPRAVKAQTRREPARSFETDVPHNFEVSNYEVFDDDYRVEFESAGLKEAACQTLDDVLKHKYGYIYGYASERDDYIRRIEVLGGGGNLIESPLEGKEGYSYTIEIYDDFDVSFKENQIVTII